MPAGERTGRLAPADGNGAGDRTRAAAQRMPVVAGFDDPLAVLLADDLAHMVRPYYHGADAHRAAPVRPIAREIVRRTWIAAHELAHFPAAPGSWASAQPA